MIRLFVGSPPERHDAVADEFIYGAVLFFYASRKEFKMTVQEVRKLGR